jgi:hypothetical protein
LPETLASIVLPEALGPRRDHIVPERLRAPGYDAGYDFRTVVYDAVLMPDRGAVWLFCPKLANFAALLRAGLAIDGTPVRVARVRRFERYDIAEVSWGGGPGLLSLSIGDWRAEVPLSGVDRETFAGRNVLLTLSKNNELRWIRDWVRFHVHEHGVDAVLFYDNGSSGYGAPEIAATLGEVDGLREVRVLSAVFPYGPQGVRRMKFRANFLQAALLNLARFRFLAPARTVLQCDVDELVVRRTATTVFDATVASRAGFLRIPGEWRFPAPTGAMPLHVDHYMRPAEARTCPPKYCIVPQGPMRRTSWATHGLHGVLFGSRFIDPRFGFLHCYGISDFWKKRPESAAARAAEVDADSRELLARVLG